MLDLIASTFEADQENIITNAIVVKVAQQNIARYDKSGEQHYDLVSAFIKSIRGSDPDAALYWMARMLKGGEDPVFIARRMLIAASEDIGNSNECLVAGGRMLPLSSSDWHAGMPDYSGTMCGLPGD